MFRNKLKYILSVFFWTTVRHMFTLRYNYSMKIYNKLIRDRIPEIIKKDGNTADIIILSDDEFKQAVKEKLIEEATEVLKADNRDDVLNELADLQEVMDTIKQIYNINTLEVNTIQAVKALQRGKFEKKLYLKSVKENN